MFNLQILHFKVSASFALDAQGTLNVTATISYPCPYPLCTPGQSEYTAFDSFANISLPHHLKLSSSSSPEIELGTVAPGTTMTVSWLLVVDDSYDKPGKNFEIVVSAQGLISGSVPFTVTS